MVGERADDRLGDEAAERAGEPDEAGALFAEAEREEVGGAIGELERPCELSTGKTEREDDETEPCKFGLANGKGRYRFLIVGRRIELRLYRLKTPCELSRSAAALKVLEIRRVKLGGAFACASAASTA